MKSALGKNEIGKFMSKAATNAGLQRSGSKVCNHSVRKTSISRLLDANTPEIFVAQLSGHKSLQSLLSYKIASVQHQQKMSNILSRTQSSSTVSLQSHQSMHDMSSTSQYPQSQLKSFNQSSHEALFGGANISNISSCQFQVFNGPVNIIEAPRKKRRIIESDDED